MNIFDLLFVGVFLTGIGAVATAAWFFFGRKFSRARRILFRVLLCAIAYMSVVIAVSLILPRRVVNPGEPQCFDDCV